MQAMSSVNYFDSSRTNQTYLLKWKSVMELHVITKYIILHDYSWFYAMYN
jgi:hypothetical protein